MYLTPYAENVRPHLEAGELGLLITPQSHRPEQYDVGEEFEYWAADNGCFTLGDRFDLDEWLSWLDSFGFEAREACLFAAAPDVVGDWEATLERSLPILPRLRELGYPAAIVVQDGATVETVPWDQIDAVFVGGSTEWKLSEDVRPICQEARRRGLWVHFGRVNSTKRALLTAELGGLSSDGTLLLFGPDKNRHRLEALVAKVSDVYGAVEAEAGSTHNPYAAEWYDRGNEEERRILELELLETDAPELVAEWTEPAAETSGLDEDPGDAERCLYCGDEWELDLLEVWPEERAFMLSACCEEATRDAIDDLSFCTRKSVARWFTERLGFKVRQVYVEDGWCRLDWGLEIREISLGDAKDFIRKHHRHNRPPVSWRWGHAVYNGEDLIGVAMVGRPVARKIDHHRVVEVNRVCIREDVPAALRWNACSVLYAAATREARGRGFETIMTYTLESETGSALKGCGWTPAALTKGGTWNRPSRPREDTAPTCRKVRWELELNPVELREAA